MLILLIPVLLLVAVAAMVLPALLPVAILAALAFGVYRLLHHPSPTR